MEKKIDIKTVIIAVLLVIIAAETFAGTAYLKSLEKTSDDSNDVAFHAETTEEIDALRTQGKPVIVVFGADYCPMCINYKPYVKETAQVFGDEVIIKYVDTVEHEAIRKEYNIELVPSTLFFDKEGKVYEPSLELEVIESDEVVEERRYVSDEFRIADEGEVPFNDQFEYGMNAENEIAYCKFVGILDMIELEQIILELIR